MITVFSSPQNHKTFWVTFLLVLLFLMIFDGQGILDALVNATVWGTIMTVFKKILFRRKEKSD